MFIDFYNKGGSPGPGPSIVVDQHYDSGSTNAQSGTAVAEAINTKQDKLVDAGSYYGNPDINDRLSGLYTEDNKLKYKFITFSHLLNWFMEKLSKKTVSSESTDGELPTGKAVWTALEDRVEKKSTTGTHVYSHNGSTENELEVVQTIDANSNNGQVPTAKAVYDDAKRILNNQYSVNSSMTFAQFLTNAGLTIPGGYAMCYVRNWNNISDKPWSADACYVEVIARDNSTRVVRVTTWVGSRMAIIAQTNGTWGTWRLIGELS